MDLLVLSPHLDDAALSVGGTIARTASEGGAVTVATAFTEGPDPGTVPRRLRAFADYGTRRREDEEALGLLGASPRWLGLRERIFTEPRPRGFLALFRTPESAEALPGLEALRASLLDLLEDHAGARVLAPLAVGGHVDHVVVFLAAVRAMLELSALERFRFYEDAYALGRWARREHFVTRQAVWSPGEAPERAGLRLRLTLRLIALARRGPPVWAFLPEEARLLGWEVERSPIGDHEEVKLRAVAAYASQVRVMGGLAAVTAALRRYHRFWGGAEPLWRPVPPRDEGRAAA